MEKKKRSSVHQLELPLTVTITKETPTTPQRRRADRAIQESKEELLKKVNPLHPNQRKPGE